MDNFGVSEASLSKDVCCHKFDNLSLIGRTQRMALTPLNYPLTSTYRYCLMHPYTQKVLNSLFLFDVHWCFACKYVCVRVLELQTVVSCHVGAGKWTWVLWKSSQYKCKCYSLEGKVSWQSEVNLLSDQKVTLHNKPHTRELLGRKSQEDGCLCLGKKQQGTEQKTGFIQVSLGCGVEQSFPEYGLVGFQVQS